MISILQDIIKARIKGLDIIIIFLKCSYKGVKFPKMCENCVLITRLFL